MAAVNAAFEPDSPELLPALWAVHEAWVAERRAEIAATTRWPVCDACRRVMHWNARSREWTCFLCGERFVPRSAGEADEDGEWHFDKRSYVRDGTEEELLPEY